MRKIGGLILLVVGGVWLNSSYQDAVAAGAAFSPYAVGTYVIPVFVLIGGISQFTRKRDSADSQEAEA